MVYIELFLAPSPHWDVTEVKVTDFEIFKQLLKICLLVLSGNYKDTKILLQVNICLKYSLTIYNILGGIFLIISESSGSVGRALDRRLKAC